ncbi:hypothetical protein ARTHRO8AJ_40167 [Arthrobacter sp. 8AJ]|nr:hypothetical protein ARTHRO8AJ_40167 [Arthrobacter sp. 8AJ]
MGYQEPRDSMNDSNPVSATE